ncbi:plasmid partitioning protein RepB [Pleomorphomonas koreensis]|uniref:plasmid partitioning protein RepB n=1 Tax=Pleomorphomonas koreensis TaxID=257440 RepID=UPI001469E062|nr:plasmid partitioning protein RepB [Pleomorphomonas koreensis]
MSKQRDRSRGILGLIDDEEDVSGAPSLADKADKSTRALKHMPSGSIKTLESTLTRAEREAEELRRLVASGAQVIELDVSLVQPSPHADRMEDDNAEAFGTLKASIAENGQQVPILVRPHPTDPDRYEAAYGHRRLRAAAELGLTVRAVVKPLTDEQLVLAQGIENSARQDLSWIEQAVFALKLGERGFPQRAIAAALSIQRQNANQMISAARKIPADIIHAIGRAPRVGRPRWLELADRLANGVSPAVRSALSTPAFSSLPSDERFETILMAAAPDTEVFRPAHMSRLSAAPLSLPGGRTVGSFVRGARAATLKLEDVDFGTWLAERVPALHAEFSAQTGDPTRNPESASVSGTSVGNTPEE